MTWKGAFLGQAESCETLGSPFTARILRLLAWGGLPTGAGREIQFLGRADFHGRWIDGQAPRPEDVKW